MDCVVLYVTGNILLFGSHIQFQLWSPLPSATHNPNPSMFEQLQIAPIGPHSITICVQPTSSTLVGAPVVTLVVVDVVVIVVVVSSTQVLFDSSYPSAQTHNELEPVFNAALATPVHLQVPLNSTDPIPAHFMQGMESASNTVSVLEL